MLEYDTVDSSEEIDVNITNASKEFDIFHYWYFKDIGLEYEPYVCNSCYDLMGKATNFNAVGIVSVKGSDYRIHFWDMRKDDVINIINNSNRNDKRCVLQSFLLICKKRIIQLIIKETEMQY